MAKTRQELDALLEDLEKSLPKMLKDCGEDTFMETFAGEADVIEDSAGESDIGHVRSRINCMLSSQGLIPGDNEGEPCS